RRVVNHARLVRVEVAVARLARLLRDGGRPPEELLRLRAGLALEDVALLLAAREHRVDEARLPEELERAVVELAVLVLVALAEDRLRGRERLEHADCRRHVP